MNSLSWMIYLADVLDGIQKTAVTVAVFGGLIALATNAAHVVYSVEEYDKDTAKALKPYARGTLITALIALVLALVAPSKETIYAIAASEMGEEVLQSPEATKARAALNAWLDKQIEQKPEKGE